MLAALLLLCFAQGLLRAQGNAAASLPSAATTPTVTLDEALSRARSNEPGFAAAAAASRVSNIDRSIARGALLPTVTYHNQFIYTQPADGVTGSSNASASSPAVSSTPRFIANNAVHEYTSQGVVTETIGLQQIAAVSRADAAAAVASAELEIARRGLVSAVVGLFYGSLAADRKLVVAQRASQEASSFTMLTEQREAAREAAHADVVKAQLQQQQRERDVADAVLQVQKTRLELAVLLFPDPRSPFTLSASAIAAPLASQSDVETAAARANPELQSALSSLRLSNLDVTSARAAYLPELGVSFAYGIDAAQFATRGNDGVRNLGYSATATLDIPVWDWLATQHKVKQAEILHDAAKITLTATQRRLIAQLDETYAEASVARDQLQSLEMSAETAKESLRLTRLRYTAGEASVLEVVDAQNSLTGAELAREDGRLRYWAALAALQMLTGTI
ncbi:TolC family protein [Granulicella sp. S190]|uniref:TolC family protein n=1 Tax=Granulicella sp. S190 TaxID=1747226 RepID=UPI0020B13DB8|nr:TolC family protein [Granulicella sp. S190]